MMPGSSRAAVLVAAIALTAARCGGTPPPGSVDPRALVEAQPPEGLELTETGIHDELIHEIVTRLENETCAVHSAIAFREDIFDFGAEAEIAELDELARRLCDAGVHRTRAGWDADGAIRVEPGAGGRIDGDGAAFLFDGFEAWHTRGRTADGTDAACGGFVGERPDLVVFPVDEVNSVVRVEADAEVFLWVRAPDDTETCSNSGAAGPHEAVLPAGEGAYQIWVGTAEAEADWDLYVEPIGQRAGSTRTWIIGAGFELPINVGPYDQPAPQDPYSYCSGHVSTEPTIRVVVAAEQYGWIRVYSDADPVLVVRGPGGEVQCNDDYDGLDPAVNAWFTPGIWEVWVGSFSPGVTFSGTLEFE